MQLAVVGTAIKAFYVDYINKQLYNQNMMDIVPNEYARDISSIMKQISTVCAKITFLFG